MAEITEKEIESGKLQALVLIEKKPRNIFDESAVFADVTVASFGREKLSAVHLVDIIAHLHRLSRKMPCGHPRACLMQDAEGTAHCAWCEEVERLRQSLAKQIHKRQSEVANALLARDAVDGTVWEWYDKCQSEVERLRELIPDAGMLHRLTYAAEKFWEGAGEQAQKDIAAGYALVERIRESEVIE